MIGCSITASEISIWKRGGWPAYSDTAEDRLPDIGGESSSGPGVAVWEELLCSLSSVAWATFWKLLPLPFLSTARSKMGGGKSVLLGSYITFLGHFLLIHAWLLYSHWFLFS